MDFFLRLKDYKTEFFKRAEREDLSTTLLFRRKADGNACDFDQSFSYESFRPYEKDSFKLRLFSDFWNLNDFTLITDDEVIECRSGGGGHSQNWRNSPPFLLRWDARAPRNNDVIMNVADSIDSVFTEAFLSTEGNLRG